MGRILLLEDNPDMLSALTELFEMHDHQVVGGVSGHDGIRNLSSGHQFDLIISDLEMPQMDGLTFLKQVRSNDNWANIPITIMSGHVKDEKVAIRAGANDFVCKPFKIDDIQKLLARYL